MHNSVITYFTHNTNAYLSDHLHHVDEILCQEDSVDMFRCAEAASFHSPFSVQTRGSVTGDVTCPQSSGLR